MAWRRAAALAATLVALGACAALRPCLVQDDHPGVCGQWATR